MRTTIAQRDLGVCRICSLRMEAGEWVSVSLTRGTAHTGCIGRRSESAAVAQTTTRPDPSSGYLFGDAQQATLEHAKEVLGVRHISFDGVSALGIDVPRLAGQLARVYELMTDGEYRTLGEIADVIGGWESSISARLRDLRKTRFGGHQVIVRQRQASPLIFEYKLILRGGKEGDGDGQQLTAA